MTEIRPRGLVQAGRVLIAGAAVGKDVYYPSLIRVPVYSYGGNVLDDWVRLPCAMPSFCSQWSLPRQCSTCKQARPWDVRGSVSLEGQAMRHGLRWARVK